MNTLLALCFMILIGITLGDIDLHPRGCIYVNGQCVEECEEGTHDYTTGCDYVTPEATCDNPHPVKDTTGQVCDFTACYCDSPTVRDTKSNKCVKLEDCPKKEKQT